MWICVWLVVGILLPVQAQRKSEKKKTNPLKKTLQKNFRQCVGVILDLLEEGVR